MPPTPSEPLVLSARRIGHLAWLEQRLFGIVGGWVAVAEDPDAMLAFGELAPGHAWRARVWHDRLPELREMPRAELTRCWDHRYDLALAELATVDDDRSRLQVLAALVLPGLAEAYAAHQARTSPVADGPVRRWLPLVQASVAADRERLAAVVGTPPRGDLPRDLVASFEGLGSLGSPD